MPNRFTNFDTVEMQEGAFTRRGRTTPPPSILSVELIVSDHCESTSQ
jgi:hypothetical protein